jgi:hypothetical protein
MSVRPPDVDTMWRKLGFDIDDSRKDVHAVLIIDGKIVIRTKRSHGAKGTSGLIPQLIRQKMRLNEDQFSAALRCPLDKPAFLTILQDKGYLPTPKA